MTTRTPGGENSKHERVSPPGFHAVLFRVTHDGLNERGTFYNVDRDCQCIPKWDSLRRRFLLQMQTGGDVSSLILKASQHLTCIDFYDPWEWEAIQKSLDLLRFIPFFSRHPQFKAPHSCVMIPREYSHPSFDPATTCETRRESSPHFVFRTQQ